MAESSTQPSLSATHLDPDSTAKESLVTHILVLNSSISREGSVSRILVEDAVQHLLEVNPGATVKQRDLGNSPVPHLTPATVAGVRAAAPAGAESRCDCYPPGFG